LKRQRSALLLSLFGALGCAPAPAPSSAPAARPPSPAAASEGFPAEAGEAHLSNLRQLTFAGENAEAYWSTDGASLILQAKQPGMGCDRIFRMNVADDPPALTPISSGKGATTCSYFLPGDREVIYASTHLGGDACPPPPDRSQGYVWALYDSYDIFKANADGSAVTRLTDSPGYDAEGTVCKKDGSIVFTSVRDGDLELYRMDADGKNVRRLTNTPGYDGGAFFSDDCSRIVWRASRPQPGKDLDDYRALLEKDLVRPSKLELYVANADGSEAVQVTYLDAASFGPYFYPSGRRIVFSSNYGDPKGREFDLFAIDDSGARLERITQAPGFDGFPMFSPDGTLLAFASNRKTPPGSHDTHVFLSRWVEGKVTPLELTPADRVLSDIRYLADPAREGRGVGTHGLDASGGFIADRFRSLGLEPAGDDKTFRQPFAVPTSLELGPATAVSLDGKPLGADDFVPVGFSPAKATVEGDLVLAGYGIVDKELGRDDYARVAVRGKIALVRRFVPDEPAFEATDVRRRLGDLRRKAWLAKERGAKALIVVDAPVAPAGAPKDWKPADEAEFPRLAPEGHGDAGIPVVFVRRALAAPLLEKLARRERVKASVAVELESVSKNAFNVVARLPANAPAAARLPGAIVVGAHYDHLGFGGRHSLDPESHAAHVGADDNASGVAGLFEIARLLTAPGVVLRRDVVFAAFSAEESGLLGSSHFVRAVDAGKVPALLPKSTFAMLNLDMIGRLRDNRLQVLGGETASEWASLVTPACAAFRVDCALAQDGGYGPSDQMSFFLAGVPVLHFFTGSHADYHKPSDTSDKINAAGAGQISGIVADVVKGLAARDKALTFNPGAKAPPPAGDLRSFNASLGTIPDYAGPGPGKSGVLIGGVRPGGAAEKGGIRRGDLLVQLGRHTINSVEDLMYALNASKPGERARAVVVREGKRVELDVTFQESSRRMK
jgi:Tol biopolymer transport system component